MHTATEPPLRGRDYALLAGLVFLLYLPGVFARDFWIYNEGRRAIIALEMLRTGQWLVPHLMGEVILTKPPLFYWSELVAFFMTGGPSDWAARIPSWLCGVLDVVALAGVLGRLLGSRAAWLGAGILAVMPIHVWMAGNAEPEMEFVALGTAALWAFVRWAQVSETDAPVGLKTKLAILCGLLLGLSFFTKGPLTPLMVLLSGWLWLALRRRWDLLLNWRSLLLPVGMVLLFAVWAALLWMKGHSPAEFASEVGAHLEGDVPHAEGPLYYLGELSHLIFPWWFVLWGAAAGCVAAVLFTRGSRTAASKSFLLRDDGARLLIVLWTAISFALLSGVPSKRYYYGLILAPSLAALAAMLLADGWHWLEQTKLTLQPAALKKIMLGAGVIAVGLLITAVALHAPQRWQQYTGRNTPDRKLLLLAFAICLAIIAVAAGRATKKSTGNGNNVSWLAGKGVAGIFTAMAVVALAYNAWIYPRHLNALFSYKLAMQDVRTHLPPGSELFSFQENHTLWFYTGQYDVTVLRHGRELPAYAAAHPHACGVAFSEEWNTLNEHARIQELYRTEYIPADEAQLVLFKVLGPK